MNQELKSPVVLIIRDGWGINPGGEATAQKDGNASLLANTPFHDQLGEIYPTTQLTAHGELVGLPEGQMGNSEVGHLNLGAGRIVFQDLTKISKAIADQTLGENSVLQSALQQAANKRLHLIGLISTGGVHSHRDHLVELCQQAKSRGVKEIYLHAISDGRDTSPQGGVADFAWLEEQLATLGVTWATLVGRYYAMDRDNRWERTQLAWDAIVEGKGENFAGRGSEYLTQAYAKGETDEFIKSVVFCNPNQTRMQEGDVVLTFNFRSDRMRQLCEPFVNKSFQGFARKDPQVKIVTMTQYHQDFDCEVLFPPKQLKNGLGETVAKAGLKQLRAAETEKYPHVTYFFNGGEEEALDQEERLLVNSPKVATYDLQPEMSAKELVEKTLPKLKDYDLVIINFANPDMVGHTGVVEAAIKSVETIDWAVEQIVKEVLTLDGQLLITADHGNCELLINHDGSVNPAHTTFPVLISYVANQLEGIRLKEGILADVAPTLLDMLDLDIPTEMTGKSLLKI